MSDQGYRIAEAARLLKEKGLLDGVYLAATGTWIRPDNLEASARKLTGFFLGAGLDHRALAEDQLFVALEGEHTDGRRFAPQSLSDGHWVLTRPQEGEEDLRRVTGPAGVLLSHDPEAALSLLAHRWRQRFGFPVVGITGSNGKTTTKDFLAALLAAAGPVCATEGNLNNRLGLPLTLLGFRAAHRFAVVEMGASAVGHIAHLAELARPTTAVITNAGQAHLEEFGSLEGVIEGKGEILDLLPAAGHAILNADSPGFETWAQRAPCPVIAFGQERGDVPWQWTETKAGAPGQVTLDGKTWSVPLPGRHNGANLVAAILAARSVGLNDEELARGLEGFRVSAHRSTILRLGDRVILDDTYNANPTSMLASAQAAVDLPGSGRVVAVLGHMAELGKDSRQLHLETGRALAGAGVDVLLAVGPAARPLAEGFDEKTTGEFCLENIQAAGEWLDAHSVPGDRILIKGSRSAGLETLVDWLRENWSEKDTSP